MLASFGRHVGRCWLKLPLLSTNVKHPKFGCHVTSLCQGLRRIAGSGGEDPENQVVEALQELILFLHKVRLY